MSEEAELVWAETCQIVLVEGGGTWEAASCRKYLEDQAPTDWGNAIGWSMFMVCLAWTVVAMVRKDWG